jgi:hypothetical protein
MKRSSRRRTDSNLPESVHQQLKAYALGARAAGVSLLSLSHSAEDTSGLVHWLNPYALGASVAGVGLLALAQSAEAKIVYTPANITLSSRLALDLNHDGVPDFGFDYFTFGRGFSLLIGPVQNNNEIVDHWSQGKRCAAALKKGVTVGPKGRFHQDPKALLMAGSIVSTGGGGHAGPWYGLIGQRYLGLKFVVNGKTHYGWARVKGKQGTYEYSLTGYAYETIPNKPIITGQTKGPEEISIEGPDAALMPISKPVSLGLLAMGAPGLSIWRRDRSIGEGR